MAVLQIASQQCVDQKWVDEYDVREFGWDDALLSRRAVDKWQLQAAVHQHQLLVAVTPESVLAAVQLWLRDVDQLLWLLLFRTVDSVVAVVLQRHVAVTCSVVHDVAVPAVLFQLR